MSRTIIACDESGVFDMEEVIAIAAVGKKRTLVLFRGGGQLTIPRPYAKTREALGWA